MGLMGRQMVEIKNLKNTSKAFIKLWSTPPPTIWQTNTNKHTRQKKVARFDDIYGFPSSFQ
jgi:hypothetical protein